MAASTTVKIDVLEPMPSAIVVIAIKEKPGRLMRLRTAYRKSWINRCIISPSFVPQCHQWIDFRCASRGQITRKQRDRDQKPGNRRKGDGIGGTRLIKQTDDEPGRQPR